MVLATVDPSVDAISIGPALIDLVDDCAYDNLRPTIGIRMLAIDI